MEERHEEKQGGIREKASPGENVLLLLIKEKIDSFLSCTSPVLTLSGGPSLGQSVPEKSGVVEY